MKAFAYVCNAVALGMAAFQKRRIAPLVFWCVMNILPVSANADDDLERRVREEVYSLLFRNENKTLTMQQEQTLAKWLRIGTEAYLKKVKGVGSWSFQERNDISEQKAVGLVYKAEVIAASCEVMLKVLPVLENASDHFPGLNWITVAEEISMSSLYMYDLMNYKLVKATWPVVLHTNLRAIFEKLIYPKMLDLELRVMRCEEGK
jgi:hypothetical protein